MIPTPSIPLLSGIASVLVALALAPAAVALEKTFIHYRWTPTKLRDDAAASSAQMAEFQFYLAGSPVSWSGASVANPGGDSPGGEGPPQLIDGDPATKWLDLNKQALIFTFPAATTIDAYRFATANDAPERDPVSWTLEGSDDQGTWTLIDAVDNYPTTTDRLTYQPFALTTTPRPGILSFQPSGAVVLDSATLDLTWSLAHTDAAAINQGVGPVNPVGGTQTVNPPDSADTVFTLTATNSGSSTTASVIVRSVAGGSVATRYVRFTPVKLRVGNTIQLAEFRFYASTTPVVPVAVTNPGGSNAEEDPEGALKAIDGDTGSKWLDENMLPLVFDFGATEIFDHYQITTANDSPERDPLRWLLESSADGITWTLIENMTAFDFNLPAARLTASQPIPLPGSSLAPPIGTIAYPNFDAAGSELELLQAAEIINAYGTLPQGGDVKRLRLTRNESDTIGAAWSSFKQSISYGFDTTFGFQFTTAGASDGADGMAFVIHNDAQATAAFPGEAQEHGLPANALNFSFDSYQNGGEASAARLLVLNGTTPLATVDLTTVAGLELFTTGEGEDLSDPDDTGNPFQVRIRYVPGDLDVFINSIQVVSNLNLNLAATDALDEDSEAYVGFTSRTGGAFESHDVTSWFFTPTAANYASWVSGYYGLSDATDGADQEHDGLTNLMEYVLNGDPSSSSTGVLPTAIVGTGNSLVFSFVRRAESKQDTQQTFQYSTNLVDWTDTPIAAASGGNVEIVPDSPSVGLERVTVTVPATAAADGTLFGRLRVIRL